MKASVNWLRFINQKYHCAADPMPDGIDKLVEKIGAQLGAVEEVIDLGKKYQGVLIVKVVECEKHPNADKLSLCLVDDDGANKSVERKDNGLIQVVCGAPNVKAGQTAVWIPPGATVPSTFNKDPFIIEARPIRNKTSHGMLASPKELDLGDSHEGILVLADKENGESSIENMVVGPIPNSQFPIPKAGDDFAKTAGLDDYVIDIENKMFTHRPDLFGLLGIAREIAGINGQPFKSPDWYDEDAKLDNDARKNVLKLSVKNDLPELVRRFCVVAIKDVKVGPSPLWLQVRLLSAGIRPINNVVDVTNFYMHETAQPLHAYDYDKVKTGVIGVRWGKKGEELKLLGGKVIKIEHDAVVITDGQKPIGLGGVMGGVDTEVDENTKSIILEVGNFDMNTTRRTAMAYGLFTDAATRFTKNQSPRQNLAVMAKAVEEIKRLAGGRQASPVTDDKHFKSGEQVVKTDAGFINSRLGLELKGSEIKKLLENVEFKVEGASELKITVPFWRTDVEIPEDVVEEVGRLYGYDRLPVSLPRRDLAPASRNLSLDFKSQLRGWLAAAGANEVLTYSFVHEKLLRAAGQDPAEAYHIRNAVSPDLQYYRLSLGPSLLEKVHANRKNGYDGFATFEIGKGHLKGTLGEDKLPAEAELLALVSLNPYAPGAPYYHARRIADYIFEKLNLDEIDYSLLADEKPSKATSWYNSYEPNRSAVVRVNGKVIGVLGEPTANLRTALKLPGAVSLFEFDIAGLYNAASETTYRPLNRFPSSAQDICLKINAKTTYGQADKLVWATIDKLCARLGYNYQIETLDIFRRPEDKLHQQITWRISVAHPERTLTTEEVNKLLDGLAAQAKQELNAERI